MFRPILAIFCCISLTSALRQTNDFLSDEYIALINSKQSSWVAGRNFDNSRRMMGVVQKLGSNVVSSKEALTLPSHYIDDNTTVLPDSFDARKQWPKCTSIGQVWDQGMCSAGWAISAASVLTDRICIKLNQTQNPVLSPEDLVSCCTKCRFGCDGGWPNFAWEYISESGVTTGGPYGSKQGCKPYTQEPCSHYENDNSEYDFCGEAQPGCISQCYKACDAYSKDTYENNIFYAQESYALYPLERQIKLEIIKNGPVQATYSLLADFLNYKNGTYIADFESEKYLGEQSVKLIGWGIDDKNQSYWLAVNSWNSEWGDKGLFQWLINQAENDMESRVYAAIPNLS